MKTPYYLIDENKLNENLMNFKDAIDKLWPNSIIGYSVKTNSLPWLLKYMKAHGVMAEVVSDEEYQLARLCGFEANQIVYNGPIKTTDQLLQAIDGKSIINLDSENDVKTVLDTDSIFDGNIGVRINVNTSYFHSEDIGFEENGFRFGFSEKNGRLETILKLISERCVNHRIGLHLHCNSQTRSITVYESIAKYAKYLIEKYQLELSYIDIGGGFFGGVPGKPTAYQYIERIQSVLKDVIDFNETKLIVEPGSSMIGSVVDLYTSVLDVKDTNYCRLITTDGSRILLDAMWQKKGYMYSLDAQKSNKLNSNQVICGYTCMDHDRIMTLNNEKEISIGDQIIYHRVGAYTITFGGPFIRYFPDVYVNKENEIIQIRKRMSVEDYYHIQNCKE